MSRFESKLAFPTAAALLALSGMASPIRADDVKSYPGSYCQPELASLDAPNMNYSQAVGVVSTAADVHVICPITKDNSANTNGLVSASVRMASGDGIGTVSCFMDAVSGLGTIVDSSLTASTTSIAPVNLALTGINVSNPTGQYAIHCIMSSAGSSVRSYRISEPSPSD